MSSLLPDPPDQPEEDQALSSPSVEEVVPEIEEPTVEAEPVPEIEEPTAEAETVPEAPVEDDWEPNGGPLGCCLGVVVGLLLSLMIALLSRFYGDALWNVFGSNLGVLTRVLMSLVAVGAAVLFGVIGWRVGRRFYRDYEPSPRQRRKLAELERREHEKYDRYKRKAKYVR